MAVPNGALEAPQGGEQAAKLLFEQKDFQGCLQVLDQLKLDSGKNPKLLHNRAIAEFFQNGGKDALMLQERLQACQGIVAPPTTFVGWALCSQTRCEELATAAEAELDGATSPSATSSSRDAFIPDGARAGEPYGWDYNTATLTFNLALIKYQQHRHSEAAALLEPLYTNLEPLDEDVALRVCFLLLDVHLANRHPAKAANVLTFLERLFSLYFPSARLSAAGKDERPRSSSEGQEKSDSTDQAEDAGPGTRPSTPADSSSIEGGHSRNASEDTADEDGAFASVPSRGRREKALEGVAGFSKPLPIGAEDFKLRLHLGRAQLHMVTHNLKGMKRELKAALSLSKEHTQALNLKAQLECSRANYRKSIKLLVSAHKPETQNPETPLISRAAFLANLGNIHHYLGKRSLASLYFSKALAEAPRSLAESAQTDSQALLYSAALEQLVAGNPLAAAQCFQQAGRKHPLLWLRLGEACIAAHRKGLLGPSSDADSSGNVGQLGDYQVRVSVAGEGPWRRVGLKGQEAGSSEASQERDGGEAGTAAANPSGLSLRFAKECLEKVLALVREGPKAEPPEASTAGGEGGAQASSRQAAAEAANGERQSNGKSGQKAGGGGKLGKDAAVNNGVPAGPTETNKSLATSSVISLGVVGQEAGLRPVVLSSSLKAGIAAYEAEQKRRNELVKQSAMIGLAYADLSLGNPFGALSNVETLLKTPGIGRVNTLLARTYAAEGLCSLGRPEEATDHLSIAITELTTAGSEPLPPVPEQGPVQDKEQPAAAAVGKPNDIRADLTGPGARAALYVNLAAAYAMKGELVEAQRCFGRASEIARDSPPVLLAGLVVDLKRGDQDEALSKLREYRESWVESHLLNPQRT